MQEILKDICNELGIKLTVFSKDWCFLLEKGEISKVISGYKFPLNDHAAGLVADDKYALYELLKIKGIPVVEHKILFAPSNKNNYAVGSNTIEEAVEYFNNNNQELVIKPNNGTCGNGVERIKNLTQLFTQINKLFVTNHSISLCPYYNIKTEYRSIILDGKIECMYAKKRPIIIGNGEKSIKELLNEFNQQYFEEENNYFNKNIDLDYIPNAGEVVEYNWQFNLAKGSQVIVDIPKEIKAQIETIALNAYKASNLNFCSVDIVETINDEYLVLEINSGVTIKRYIDLVPNGYQTAKEIYKKAIIKMFNLKY